MSTIAEIGALVGVAIIVLAAVGLIKFRTPYARIHAAGKASPVAFMVVGIAASVELGWAGAAPLLLAVIALLLTLPLAVHLLFRAVHASSPEFDPEIDEMPSDERATCSARRDVTARRIQEASDQNPGSMDS